MLPEPPAETLPVCSTKARHLKDEGVHTRVQVHASVRATLPEHTHRAAAGNGTGKTCSSDFINLTLAYVSKCSTFSCKND